MPDGADKVNGEKGQARLEGIMAPLIQYLTEKEGEVPNSTLILDTTRVLEPGDQISCIEVYANGTKGRGKPESVEGQSMLATFRIASFMVYTEQTKVPLQMSEDRVPMLILLQAWSESSRLE